MEDNINEAEVGLDRIKLCDTEFVSAVKRVIYMLSVIKNLFSKKSDKCLFRDVASGQSFPCREGISGMLGNYSIPPVSRYNLPQVYDAFVGFSLTAKVDGAKVNALLSPKARAAFIAAIEGQVKEDGKITSFPDLGSLPS